MFPGGRIVGGRQILACDCRPSAMWEMRRLRLSPPTAPPSCQARRPIRFLEAAREPSARVRRGLPLIYADPSSAWVGRRPGKWRRGRQLPGGTDVAPAPGCCLCLCLVFIIEGGPPIALRGSACVSLRAGPHCAQAPACLFSRGPSVFGGRTLLSFYTLRARRC